MDSPDPYAVRFREARERAGLSVAEAAELMGISPASLWDAEDCDEELMIYSPDQIQRFCQALGITPGTLFGVDSRAAPLAAPELVPLIREHCHTRGVSMEQFEDSAGWKVAHNLNEPEKFQREYCMEAIRDICGELGVDWHHPVAGGAVCGILYAFYGNNRHQRSAPRGHHVRGGAA